MPITPASGGFLCKNGGSLPLATPKRGRGKGAHHLGVESARITRWMVPSEHAMVCPRPGAPSGSGNSGNMPVLTWEPELLARTPNPTEDKGDMGQRKDQYEGGRGVPSHEVARTWCSRV